MKMFGFRVSCFAILWPVLLCAELFHPDSSVLIRGPAYAASAEGTSAVFLNPACLFSSGWFDASIDIDGAFRYNAVGSTVRLGRLGTAGLAAYRHRDDSYTHVSAGFGRTAFSWGGTNRPCRLDAGLGFHLIRETDGSDALSVDPGLLVKFGWTAGPLRTLSIGAATYGLFAGYVYRNFNLGLNTVFENPAGRRTEVSVGAGLAHDENNRSVSFVIAAETWKDLFVSAGLWGRGFIFGIDFRGRTAATIGLRLGLDESESVAGLLFRLTVPTGTGERSKPELPVVKTSRTVEPLRISPQDAERQKILLQEGVDLYSSDRLSEAQKKWEEVLKISPDTAEGRQAQVYIRLVRSEIQRIRK